MYRGRHIYTVQKVTYYELLSGDAGGGGSNLRFFGRRFRGRVVVETGRSVVAKITDGMIIGGSRRE